MNYYLCFFSCIIFLNCFVNNTIVNSCGKVGSERPQSKDDCKSDDSDNCCYIQVPEKDIAYCGSVPGKINDDVIKEVQSVLSSNIGISSILIDCNFTVFISYSIMFLILIIFFII